MQSRLIRRVLAPLVLASAVVSAQVPAPDFWIDPVNVDGGSMLVDVHVQGPPMSQYVVFYVLGNPFLDPLAINTLGVICAGGVGQTGLTDVLIPVLPGLDTISVPEATTVALLQPPSGPPIVTELVALSLTSAAATAVPGPVLCIRTGSMTYNDADCILTVEAHVCPGDVVEMKVNGVTILSGTAPASGIVVLSSGGVCMGPGDSATATCTGFVGDFLGPIRGE